MANDKWAKTQGFCHSWLPPILGTLCEMKSRIAVVAVTPAASVAFHTFILILTQTHARARTPFNIGFSFSFAPADVLLVIAIFIFMPIRISHSDCPCSPSLEYCRFLFCSAHSQVGNSPLPLSLLPRLLIVSACRIASDYYRNRCDSGLALAFLCQPTQLNKPLSHQIIVSKTNVGHLLKCGHG